ncbi:dipeptidase [Massilia glaciei]|uniref:Dipeptidase n=1 Tax=Massilia glaciei TaxID=1524097 RepID=A0A2U2I4U6_9BURK|nr:dipeptidase [Massilia glaciei]PWF54828.1 dipeptidase [Massilia glaciei]
MPIRIIAASLLLAFGAGAGAAPGPVPGPAAVKAASHAVGAYRGQLVELLAKMVSFNTVADPALAFDKNPQHTGFKQLLRSEAERLGLDFTDHGHVVVVGLGAGGERVGVITHGDIQPVDPSKWKKSPFELDTTSEPGRLIGRGTEDDKGPIATAMLAMKAIKDQAVPLSKRLELYVYMAEESDWEPLREFLKTHVPPQINITIDAEYPVVTAEKGYGTVSLTFARPGLAAPAGAPAVSAFGGGFFGSQIPEDAHATIAAATPALEARIKARAAGQSGMRYHYAWQGQDLVVKARGVSAHSSKPEDGVNAVSMLADALKVHEWPATPAGGLVNFLNDMIGTGIHGEKFGRIAYSDKFMGPMTFAPTVIRQKDQGIELSINLRRPQGKTGEALTAEINAALAQWQARRMPLANVGVLVNDPWLQKKAPQVPTLLSVFSYYTGIKNPKPVAIGGGTNSRLFPNAVSFGPSMPGAVYSGHSEHEFITLRQLLLNLQMYTAVMVELAK